MPDVSQALKTGHGMSNDGKNSIESSDIKAAPGEGASKPPSASRPFHKPPPGSPSRAFTLATSPPKDAKTPEPLDKSALKSPAKSPSRAALLASRGKLPKDLAAAELGGGGCVCASTQ